MKLILLLAMLLSFTADAQTFPGIHSGIDSSTLRSTDNKNDGRHYKELAITLKKGMGAVFYMESSEFRPYLILFSNGDGKFFGAQRVSKENGADRVTVSYTAMADTSFFLIFTTNDPDATGKFHYGFSIVDAAQMEFRNDFTLCQRLNYLITQWQLNWELLPVSKAFHTDEADPEMSYEYRVTANSLVSGASTEIERCYKEVLFSTKDLGADDKFYDKFCGDIFACLDANTWERQSEIIDEKISAYSSETRKKIITHFYQKGFKGVPFKSFDIWINNEFGAGILKPFEVLLRFN